MKSLHAAIPWMVLGTIAAHSSQPQAACPTSGGLYPFLICISNNLTAAEGRIVTLTAGLGATEADLIAAEDRIAELEAELAGLEHLRDYVTVDTVADRVLFTGANVYVRSGSGATDGAANGLGNLIIGYNESDGSQTRAGSHNLVLGSFNSWSSFGGIDADDVGTYPDVQVVCGPLQTSTTDRHASTNPVLLVEVLSDSTEARDRGGKFEHYEKLPSLRHYVLVSQGRRRIEHFERNDDRSWTRRVAGASEHVRMQGLCDLSVDAVYERVETARAEAQTGQA